MVAEASTDGAPGAAVLEALLRLQDLDTAIAQLQHRKISLPERRQLADAEASMAAATTRAAEATAARDELAGRQSELERQIATVEARRGSLERRLYAARGTPSRELQAIDEEIHHLSDRQSELEEHELELMVAQEPMDATLSEVAAERERLAFTAEELRRLVDAAEDVIERELAGLLAARSDTASAVPPELRSRYEALRARLGGIGAARLVGNRCSGCHLELPAMEVDRIRHLPPGTVVTCDQCGRLLVPVSSSPGGEPADGA